MSLEDTILAHFLDKPELIKEYEIDIDFFKGQEQRLIFKELKQGNNDPVLIAEKIKLKGITSYLSKIMIPDLKSDAKNLPKYIAEVKIERLKGEGLKFIDQGLKSGFFEYEKIKEIYDEINELQQRRDTYSPESFETLLNKEIPEQEKLIDPLIGKQEIIVLSGPPKIGKSILSLNMAVSLARAISWTNFEIKDNHKTLIFQSEVSELEFKKRLMKIISNDSNNEKTYLKKIFHVTKTGLLINKPDGFNEISQHIKSINPDLVIFDSFIDYHSLRENEASDMARIFQSLRMLTKKYNVAILLIHHFAKISEGREREGGYMARGSGVISSSSDGNWQFQRLRREKYEINDEDYFKTCELNFELRNYGFVSPVFIRMNQNLWFKKIEPRKKSKLDEWDIYEAVENAGGQALQTELEKQFVPGTCSKGWFIRAVKNAELSGILDSIELKEKGRAKMLMIPGRGRISD